jgi:hypothetical protein
MHVTISLQTGKLVSAHVNELREYASLIEEEIRKKCSTRKLNYTTNTIKLQIRLSCFHEYMEVKY